MFRTRSRRAQRLPPPVCLLDVGDNVGGGSAGDGTALAAELQRRGSGKSFVCIYDPESVAAAEAAGTGATRSFRIGGKTDRLHGDTLLHRLPGPRPVRRPLLRTGNTARRSPALRPGPHRARRELRRRDHHAHVETRGAGQSPPVDRLRHRPGSLPLHRRQGGQRPARRLPRSLSLDHPRGHAGQHRRRHDLASTSATGGARCTPSNRTCTGPRSSGWMVTSPCSTNRQS